MSSGLSGDKPISMKIQEPSQLNLKDPIISTTEAQKVAQGE